MTDTAPVSPAQGIAVAPVPLNSGLLTTIPLPTLPRGPVPWRTPWIVILNSSPFTLLVSTGSLTTQIAAFTSDKVFVYAQGTPITVLPQPAIGAISPGTDSTVYATWYAEEPPGTYPAALGSGQVPITLSNLYGTIPIANIFGPVFNTFGPEQPSKALQSIRLLWIPNLGSVGAPIQVSASTDVDTFPIIPTTNLPDGGTVTMPFPSAYFNTQNGASLTVTCAPVPGGVTPISGKVLVFLFNSEVVTTPNIRGAFIGFDEAGNAVTCPGGGVTTQVLAAPVAGYYYKIKALSWTITAAPAAAAALRWNVGSSGGTGGPRSIAPAAATADFFMPCDVATQSPILLTNNATVSAIASVWYERWPF
jgi:hypothetical protein